MRVFILAAGEQTRFVDRERRFITKQLLVFDGQTLIERTIAQAKMFTDSITVVTHQQDITKAVEDKAGIFKPKRDQRRTTCHTILSTVPMWDEKTIILLGDVRYTYDAVRKIFNSNSGITLWTDLGDFFAITIFGFYTGEMLFYLNRAIDRFVNYGLVECPILEMYRGIADYHGEQRAQKLLSIIDDETQDFDRPYEYDDFINGFYKNRLYGAKRPDYAG